MFTETADLESGARAIIEDEKDLIANLANLSAHIYHSVPGLNWAGFYIWNQADGELVLGPFQGRPACIRIRADRGVCGKAYSTRQTQRIDDVNLFPGHIACDSRSRSELVVPLLVKSGDGASIQCVGVLDLDAPTIAHFSPELAARIETLMHELVPKLWPPTPDIKARELRTFAEFWPFYLSEHSDRFNRRLHFWGTSLVFASFAMALLTHAAEFLCLMPRFRIRLRLDWAFHRGEKSTGDI